MMKIYIHQESQCAYRIAPEDVVEFAALGDMVNVVLSDDDFDRVDYELVGDETITHEGEPMTIKEFENVIREALK